MEALLYIADDIQLLAGGKILTVGLYADRVVVVQDVPDPTPASEPNIHTAIASLSLMLSFVGIAPGERTVEPQLLLPDGSLGLQQIRPAKIEFGSTGSANLVFKFTPFLVPQAGLYKVRLSIDEIPIEVSFEVRFEATKTP